jgi:serine/threonine protein kinase
VTPEKWRQVRPVFAKAAKIQNPTERAVYLARACQRKEWLRQEVESLLLQEKKSGTFLEAPSSVGKTISHYRLLKLLGGGGMGVIYKALDTHLDRVVVLKSLPPWMMSDRRAKARLIREAKSASALNHPHVVTIHAIAEEKDDAYIVMEYVAGKTLDCLIPAKGLHPGRALRFAVAIADAMAAVHKAGILHGDLKPLNVMIGKGGHVKVLDFGLASVFAAERQTSDIKSLGFGTKAYMAPELLLDPPADPDPRSEIFAFGLILHQMLGGRHPFYGEAPKSVTDAILSKPPNSLPTHVPRPVSDIVYRCLQKDPGNRFASMQDVLTSLQKAMRQLPSSRTVNIPRQKTSASVKEGEIDVNRVRKLAERIDYANLASSRRALAELTQVLEEDHSAALRQEIIVALKGIILTLGDYEGPVPMSVRELRQQVMALIKSATQGNFGRCFDTQDLEFLDLYGMNFDSGDLTGLSFRGCFLVEASFQGSRLGGTCFARSCLRNANFANAELAETDFTDADWFNAIALTELQLKAVRPDTLIDSPASMREMHEYLAARYVVPFRAFPARIQQELLATWNEYLKPNGLHDVVSSWQRKPR